MRKLISATMMGVMAMGLCVGISGCSEDTTSTKSTTESKTPDGKTKVTEEKKVETSGANPPAPAKP